MRNIVGWLVLCMLLLAVARDVAACPNCRDAIAVAGEEQQNQQDTAANGGASAKTHSDRVTMGQGINLTIILALVMLTAMVFGIIKFIAAAHREEERAIQAQAQSTSADSSPVS